MTNSFSTLSNVFSGTVIFLAASSNIAMRSVNDLSANPGIFLVEVYIFKLLSRESKLEYYKRDSSKLSSFGSCFSSNKKGGAPKK